MDSRGQLENRVLNLCHRVVSAEEGEEFTVLLDELQKALREHAEYVRHLAAEGLTL